MTEEELPGKISKEGKAFSRRKEGRKEGRKDGRKEGNEIQTKQRGYYYEPALILKSSVIMTLEVTIPSLVKEWGSYPLIGS